MKLEVNKNDASLDTRELPQKNAVFQRTIAGLLTTLVLFSGSLIGPTTVYAAETPSTSQSQSYVDPSTVVEIPEAYQYTVADLCGKEKGDPITVGDLSAVNDSWLSLPVYDDVSFEWLNYLGHVDYISFIVHTDDTSVFQQIEKLNNVQTISIMSALSKPVEVNSKDFAFLKRSTKVSEVSFSGEVELEPGFVESLTHLKKLSLYLQDGNHTYDCTKLGFLDELKLYDPYTAAMYITQEEYDYLRNNGVKISFSTEADLKTFIEINKRIDSIVSSLDVDKNSTDQEKLDAILCYVLETLTYDEDVSRALYNNESIRDLADDFYIGGLLYGALEKDSAICGNYAALTNALSERLGLYTYYLTSHNHAWSLIEVDGKQYYVDSTWLDGQSAYKTETTYEYDDFGNVISTMTSYIPTPAHELIAAGTTEDLEWYMEDPTSYPKSATQKESHIVVNLPSFFGITPQEETEESETVISQPEETTPQETTVPETTPTMSEEEQDETTPLVLDGQDVEIRSGNKSWIVPSAVAIGVLTAIGGAVAVKKNKEKKERERRRQQQSTYAWGYDDLSYSPYSTTDDWDSLFPATPKTPPKKSGRRK